LVEEFQVIDGENEGKEGCGGCQVTRNFLIAIIGAYCGEGLIFSKSWHCG